MRRHTRQPLTVSADSAFTQTNKPVAFSGCFHLFMFSLCYWRFPIASPLNIQIKCVCQAWPSLDTQHCDALLKPIGSAPASSIFSPFVKFSFVDFFTFLSMFLYSRTVCWMTGFLSVSQSLNFTVWGSLSCFCGRVFPDAPFTLSGTKISPDLTFYNCKLGE